MIGDREAINSAKLIYVIETKSRRGNGTPSDPYREVIEFWEIGGRKIGEIDALNEKEQVSPTPR